MKIFPSAGGRRLWVRTDAAAATTDDDIINAANQYVRRSRKVATITGKRTDAATGHTWYELRVRHP